MEEFVIKFRLLTYTINADYTVSDSQRKNDLQTFDATSSARNFCRTHY